MLNTSKWLNNSLYDVHILKSIS